MKMRCAITAMCMLAALSVPQTLLAEIPEDLIANQWSYKDVHLADAQKITKGSPSVVVAVIDNGIDVYHPYLADHIWHNPDNGIDAVPDEYPNDTMGWNFVDNTNDPRPDVTGQTDSDSTDKTIHHGTLVAGIILAIAPNIEIMNVKVIGNIGVEQTSRLASAIRYAADNGASVINISIVGPTHDGDIRDAVKYAYDRGVVVVAAAGNDNESLNDVPREPICADAGQSEDWVLGVSAIDETHHLAPFSNVGASCIDLTAPGVRIKSTLRYAPRFGWPDLFGGPYSGTSFSAPFVSGTAALIKSIHPEWKAKQIIKTILSTVHKTPPLDEAAYREAYGAGLLQIDKAIAYAVAQGVANRAHPVRQITTHEDGILVTSDAHTPANREEQTTETLPPHLAQILPYHTNSENGYIAVSDKNKRHPLIIIYDREWRARQTWPSPFEGSVSLAFGTFASSTEPNVVIAPAIPNKTVFQAYALSGKKTGKFAVKKSHRGVTLGVSSFDGRDRLLAIFAPNKNPQTPVALHRFDEHWRVSQAFDLADIRNTGTVVSGDIAGDGTETLIVGGGKGDTPYLSYYSANGDLTSQVYAYSPEETSGLLLAVGDFEQAGRDDVIVGTRSAENEITVWNNQMKKVIAWNMMPIQSSLHGIYTIR